MEESSWLFARGRPFVFGVDTGEGVRNFCPGVGCLEIWMGPLAAGCGATVRASDGTSSSGLSVSIGFIFCRASLAGIAAAFEAGVPSFAEGLAGMSIVVGIIVGGLPVTRRCTSATRGFALLAAVSSAAVALTLGFCDEDSVFSANEFVLTWVGKSCGVCVRSG